MGENANLELWNMVEKTDPDYVKEFVGGGGFKGTAIAAQYQKKTATEKFGIYGEKWGVNNFKFEVVSPFSNDEHYNTLVFMGDFYAEYNGKKIEFPIVSSINFFEWNRAKQEWRRITDPYKKVVTDATTKALSNLGFNADVFMNDFNLSKYLNDKKRKEQEEGQGNSDDKKQITFLTEKQFKNYLTKGTIQQIEKVLRIYNTDTFKMKRTYREMLENRILELTERKIKK